MKGQIIKQQFKKNRNRLIGKNSTFTLLFIIPFVFILQRNLTEYYNACGIEVMYGVFAAMLKERRIIITSNKLPRLSACVQASKVFSFKNVST